MRIGRLDGPPEYSLGLISCVTPLRDGGVVLFDGSVPALRVYDGAGRLRRTLGRQGSGPGEYRDTCLGVLVDPDGSIWMYDPRNARLNRYDGTGAPLPTVRTPAPVFSRDDLIRDPRGRIFVKIAASRSGRSRLGRLAYVQVYPESVTPDTLHLPEIAGDHGDNEKWGPTKVYAWSPTGYFVAGFGDRYTVSSFRGPRDVLRIERVVPRIPVGREERVHWERVLGEAYRRDPHHDPPSVADPKAVFSALTVDADTRIWVRLHMPSRRSRVAEAPVPGLPPRAGPTWLEDRVYDVFQPDGSYLGQVALRPRSWLAAASGDKLWVVQLGELDEAYLIRYRLVRP